MSERTYVIQPTQFSDWVAKRRTEQRMTMSECARRVGITPSRWQQIEVPIAGKSGAPVQPRRDVVEYVCKALGEPLTEGLRAAGYAYEKEPQDTTIQVFFDNMNPDGQQALLAIAKVLYAQFRRL